MFALSIFLINSVQKSKIMYCKFLRLCLKEDKK